MKRRLAYRVLSAELNQLLADMQSGELDVDEAVVKYERGQALITQLNEYIDATENKIVIRRPNDANAT